MTTVPTICSIRTAVARSGRSGRRQNLTATSLETLPALWQSALSRFAALPAVIDGDTTTLTYRSADEAIRRWIVRIHDAAPSRGTVLMLWCDPHPALFPAFWAAMHLGHVIVAVDPLAPAGAATAMAHRLDARVVITDRGPGSLALPDGAALLAPTSAAAAAGALPPLPRVSPDDPAVIALTSGTTADSKAVVLSQRCLVRNALATVRSMGIGAGDRSLTAAGVHVLGCLRRNFVDTVCSGGAFVVGPNSPVNQVANLWACAADTGATNLWCPPAALSLARDLRRAGHLPEAPRLRLVQTGGAPLTRRAVQELATDLGTRVLVYYGSTEAGGPCTEFASSDAAGDPADIVLGRPIAMAASVRAEDGAEISDGLAGELWLRSDRMMLGYRVGDGLDRSMFTDGWYRTGDVVRRNAAGELVMLGRLASSFSLPTGQLVSPEGIEAVLEQHPAVAACAVGLATLRNQRSVLAALVVPRAGLAAGDALAADLRHWARACRSGPCAGTRRVLGDSAAQPDRQAGPGITAGLSRPAPRRRPADLTATSRPRGRGARAGRARPATGVAWPGSVREPRQGHRAPRRREWHASHAAGPCRPCRHRDCRPGWPARRDTARARCRSLERRPGWRRCTPAGCDARIPAMPPASQRGCSPGPAAVPDCRDSPDAVRARLARRARAARPSRGEMPTR